MLLLLALAAAPAPKYKAPPKPPPVVVSSLESAQLARACDGRDDDPSPSFCTGYILGVFDALSLAHQICPSPTKASTLTAIAAARKALRTHPDRWDSAPSFIVRDALKAAFPCTRR
ncbi:Rap1a/Tai family immunity protein [Sphingomonas sp. MMS24-J45]|uniref:Rap1a/Tai family immunity protein n=1 Tax=Sphingomonas sp. MMS24-J45 TaxID=3238806 RepID=UPI0038508042